MSSPEMTPSPFIGFQNLQSAVTRTDAKAAFKSARRERALEALYMKCAVQFAKEHYADAPFLQIDEKPKTARAADGTWVSSWTLIPDSDIEINVASRKERSRLFRS